MPNQKPLHGKLQLLPRAANVDAPCIGKCRCNIDVKDDDIIGPYRNTWKVRFLAGHADMEALQKSSEGECAECRAERARRHRVLTNSAVRGCPSCTENPSTVHLACIHSTCLGTLQRTCVRKSMPNRGTCKSRGVTRRMYRYIQKIATCQRRN